MKKKTIIIILSIVGGVILIKLAMFLYVLFFVMGTTGVSGDCTWSLES